MIDDLGKQEEATRQKRGIFTKVSRVEAGYFTETYTEVGNASLDMRRVLGSAWESVRGPQATRLMMSPNCLNSVRWKGFTKKASASSARVLPTRGF